MSEKPTFKRGVGRWAGTAEVYDGNGQFLGHALDQRNVQQISDNQLRIDLSFTGPLMLSGYYVIETHERHRLYRGPVNVGYAEALGEGLVDANNYWAQWGLSQRFFLYVTPDKMQQYSLSLLSRGEQLMYTIIGEYQRVSDADDGPPVLVPEAMMLPGTPKDRAGDPTNGRGELLIHKPGVWSGEVTVLGENLDSQQSASYSQEIMVNADKTITSTTHDGRFLAEPYEVTIQTNNWQGWTPTGNIVGSYNLVGGRALSGQFHHLDDEIRVWKREVVSTDCKHKAILHNFYRGGSRVGVQYGLLRFQENA